MQDSLTLFSPHFEIAENVLFNSSHSEKYSCESLLVEQETTKIVNTKVNNFLIILIIW